MKVLSKEENKIRVIVDKATPGMMNSLRRAAMYKVPTLAIEHCYFTENNSVMYDEQIAIRLGLLALKCDTSKFNLPAECKCKGEGCKSCQVKVTLSEKGPKMVLAKDLKIEGAEILHPETPIVWLNEGHKVELTAAAVLGVGEDHAKWNTGLVFYQNYPKIAIKDKDGAKEGVKHCPRNVFNGNEVENAENCNMCGACSDYSEGAIQVSEVADKFILTIESWGSLTPKEILAKAVESVSKDLDEVKLK